MHCKLCVHAGLFYRIWTPDKPTVNRKNCTCGCFDTLFKGRSLRIVVENIIY